MTIGEANAVNVLLDVMVGGRAHQTSVPSQEEIWQAQDLLAKGANKALSAGWSHEELARRRRP